jgi:uncharacterized protein (UPF0297 family)
MKINVMYACNLLDPVEPIETQAQLDLDTGKIEIELEEIRSLDSPCENERVSIDIVDISPVQLEVNRDAGCLQLTTGAMDQIRAIFSNGSIFRVLTLVSDDFEHTDTLHFSTLDAARKDLQQHLINVIDAVKNGDMMDEYDPSEYMIQDVISGDNYIAKWTDDSKQHISVARQPQFNTGMKP